MSRVGYVVAHELAQNSRSGLTVRFLSKKLELPEEEVEYLVDLNHRLLFQDISKVKIVPEGVTAIKRIALGLESHGDVPSLFNLVKSLTPHEFRVLEEHLDIEKPGSKRAVAEELVSRFYRHPESIVEFVASRGFSPIAKEIFDIVWQSDGGLMAPGAIQALHGGNEFEVEQALSELFRSFALFEMYRFDAEDRLVRFVGLLKEIRQWREACGKDGQGVQRLKPVDCGPDGAEPQGLSFSDVVCRLVAAIAARPARLRGDGDLFREDRRRLGEICAEEGNPPLATCLWVAQGVEWLTRVDSELRAAELEPLLTLHRIHRHKTLFDWLTKSPPHNHARRIFTEALEDIEPGEWYRVADFVRHATRKNSDREQPTLKAAGGQYHYVSPSAAPNAERDLARAVEETYAWLGAVDYADAGGEGYIRLTELGAAFFGGQVPRELLDKYRERKAELIVQPNFDIVVPAEEMDPLLTVPLDQFAVRQSTGQATVYHLSKESFLLAVQEGHDGGAFIDFLLTHNRGGQLPANVLTTLEDWRGGMKRVRIRTVMVVESDDPLVLADLMHRKKLSQHVQRIDAGRTASYSKITKAQLRKELEREGFVVD
jgi:hypothetical protein